ncbi:sucrase ferredoxin [Corynebacterium yudongzhengii]|uniref:Sucrase ferredoxin n=1 Tax=Corynebacterium yudongzhengii TaxID=2080740 RepID=A0A2U1T8J4_9CORY|nr:sucrase ferredoxin [Corynebacterium yudongzhengii]AWB81939.1 sucrase ferredoxin [Corynebacterium yudongzhengii]PWC02331.1 sucrase ferredoxin [Corynebacterium yudongzhengii]
MSTHSAVRCSDVPVEPLAGSAKEESVYVIFEHPQGWSRDILDGDTFGPELTEKLRAKLKGHAGLQLIRHPGREGRSVTKRHLFIVHARQRTCEKLLVDDPTALLHLDLERPGGNGGEMIDTPLVLVCTHGKRDVCCAVKGRPLAAALDDAFPDTGIVWETSHTKGHRFAPSILLMPWGYSFGRLNESAAEALVRYAQEGRYYLPGNRGCGGYGARGQVAELAVAEQLIVEGEELAFSDLTAQDNIITHADGRSWEVDLEQQAVEGVVSSCGKAPADGKVWVATGIAQTAAG